MGLGAWFVEVVALEFDSCEKYGISPRVRTIVVTVVIKGSKAPTIITERTKSAINVGFFELFFGSFGRLLRSRARAAAALRRDDADDA